MNHLTTTFLEEMAEQGCCKRPDCEGCENDDTFFLHSRCHMQAPFFLLNAGNIVRSTVGDERTPNNVGEFWLKCCDPECPNGFFIEGELVSEGQFSPDHVFAQKCHPDNALWASYTKGSAEICIICYECGEEVAKIKLRR